MMFGGPTDAATSARASSPAPREPGVNFLDTADGYNAGRSEEVVGRAIAANRHMLGAGDQDRQPDRARARTSAACRAGG